MKPLFNKLVPMAVLAVATLSACNNRADVEVHNDSTAAQMDTASIMTPADTASVTSNMDTLGTNSDTTNVGTALKDESIEKVVEAKLIVKPGFSNVKVESQGNGTIVLNGTVGSKAERDAAEQTAKMTDGVKSVKNNLTISK
jgi:hyperosmotically inducible protein